MPGEQQQVEFLEGEKAARPLPLLRDVQALGGRLRTWLTGTREVCTRKPFILWRFDGPNGEVLQGRNSARWISDRDVASDMAVKTFLRVVQSRLGQRVTSNVQFVDLATHLKSPEPSAFVPSTEPREPSEKPSSSATPTQCVLF